MISKTEQDEQDEIYKFLNDISTGEINLDDYDDSIAKKDGRTIKRFNFAQKVNVLNVKSKPKRYGRYMGRRPGFKKAYVTLEEGSKINFLE